MKPTIGRVVLFNPNGTTMPSHLTFRTGQPAKADVVYVHSDSMVNLSIIDHNGVAHPMTSVPLVQEGDTLPPEGMAYATWMPFQVGQAKAGLVERVAHIEDSLEKASSGDFKRFEAPTDPAPVGHGG